MRSSGVAARTGQADSDPICSCRDRTCEETDLADLDLGIAVDRERPLDAVEFPVTQHVDCSAGAHLLGRLEDQADRSSSCPASASSASTSAAPSTTAVCASWPHAWQTPSTLRAVRARPWRR